MTLTDHEQRQLDATGELDLSARQSAAERLDALRKRQIEEALDYHSKQPHERQAEVWSADDPNHGFGFIPN